MCVCPCLSIFARFVYWCLHSTYFSTCTLFASYIECASLLSRLCPPILFRIFLNNTFPLCGCKCSNCYSYPTTIKFIVSWYLWNSCKMCLFPINCFSYSLSWNDAIKMIECTKSYWRTVFIFMNYQKLSEQEYSISFPLRYLQDWLLRAGMYIYFSMLWSFIFYRKF